MRQHADGTYPRPDILGAAGTSDINLQDKVPYVFFDFDLTIANFLIGSPT